MTGWLGFTVLAGLLAASERVGHRFILHTSEDATAYTIAYQLAASLALAPIVLGELMSYRFTADHLGYYFALLLSGLFWAAFGWLSFQADSIAEVSVTSVLSRTRAIWTMLIGITVFGEAATVARISGAILVLIGALLLGSRATLRANRGAVLALLAAISISVSLSFDSYATTGVPAGLLSVSAFLTAAAVTSLFTKQRGRRLIGLMRGRGRLSLATAAVGGLSYWALVEALARGDISQVVPVYQSYLILVVVAGILLLGERDHAGRKLGASAVVLIGAMLVSLG